MLWASIYPQGGVNYDYGAGRDEDLLVAVSLLFQISSSRARYGVTAFTLPVGQKALTLTIG